MTLDNSAAQENMPLGQHAQSQWHLLSESKQSGELVITCMGVIGFCSKLQYYMYTEFAMTVGLCEVDQDETHGTQQQPPTDDTGIINSQRS